MKLTLQRTSSSYPKYFSAEKVWGSVCWVLTRIWDFKNRIVDEKIGLISKNQTDF